MAIVRVFNESKRKHELQTTTIKDKYYGVVKHIKPSKKKKKNMTNSNKYSVKMSSLR